MKFFLIIPCAVIVSALPLILLAAIYGGYLRLPRGKAYLLALAAIAVSIGMGVYHINVRAESGNWRPYVGKGDLAETISAAAMFLLPLVATAFLAKLYLTWVAGHLTEGEKVPGLEGARAWLRYGNLICAVLLAFCLWIGFGYSFWTPVLLCLMALLAYPMMNMAVAPPPTAAPAADALSPERERVLKMLDDGKITAQESAELLNALGHSAPVPPRAEPSAPSPHRRMVWIGAALLLVGFFLPWFVYNPQNVVNDLMSRVPMPGGAQLPNLSGMMPQGSTLYLTGGDIGHGLGWWVLLLGVVAAALPFVAAHLDSQTCQKVCLVALSGGAIILVYLLTRNIRYAGVGILLGLAGYVLEFIGVLKEHRLEWARAV